MDFECEVRNGAFGYSKRDERRGRYLSNAHTGLTDDHNLLTSRRDGAPFCIYMILPYHSRSSRTCAATARGPHYFM